MKILVPVDGSASSTAAVRFVASRLNLGGAAPVQVDLLNVQLPIPAYPARVVGTARVRAYHEAEAKSVLAPAAAILRKAGVDAKTRFVVGSPGTTVARIAAREADLVVMGAHGHTATAGLLFGSVSNAVLASCTTPVLIVRGPARAAKGALRIGIAVDGSRHSTAAMRYLLEHRGLFGEAVEITLINVVPDLLAAYVPGLAQIPMAVFSPEQAIDTQNAAFEAALAPARKLVQQAGVAAAEVRLIGNVPGDQIAAYAKEKRLDVLVMGSHGYTALKSVVLGSVATRVAAKCQTPLLVIRPGRKERPAG
jgi:nucleotide-binding universal stress UspA family protein